MSAEETRVLLERFFEGFWNGGDEDICLSLVAPTFVRHDPNIAGFPEGPEGLLLLRQIYLEAFPDFQVTVEDLIAEPDKAAVRLTIRGTHRGEFMGLPASGRQFAMDGIDIFHLENGQITESWTTWDTLGLIQQLAG